MKGAIVLLIGLISLFFASCSERSELEMQLSQKDVLWKLYACICKENKFACDSSNQYYEFRDDGTSHGFIYFNGQFQEVMTMDCVRSEPRANDEPQWTFKEKDSLLTFRGAEFKVDYYNSDTINLKFVKHPEIGRALIRSKRKLLSPIIH